MRHAFEALTLFLLLAAPSAQAAVLDTTPRTAIVTAFPPEWDSLRPRLKHAVTHELNGTPYVTGTLEGRAVVLTMSGVSMVNAAMNTQALLDHFRIRRIVFSGIAGGIDPEFGVGDVVVPQSWAQSLEVVMARETPEGFKAPAGKIFASDLPAYGMMIPRPVSIGGDATGPITQMWFNADPALLKIATTLPATALKGCTDDGKCLEHTPRVVVGGHGVSSPAFVDNAAYRQYLFSAYQAHCTDMESAAVAQVAQANHVPFIVFRSLSDLAGGDAGDNQMRTFMGLAAENSARVVTLFVKALPPEKTSGPSRVSKKGRHSR